MIRKYLLLLIVSFSLSVTAQSQEPFKLDSQTRDNVYLHEQVSSLEAKIDANDKRYEQRFADSEKAVNAALSAADKAVASALQAAKEAVIKAELANEKHFDSVNEFRKTLGDQANGFVTKDSLWAGLVGTVGTVAAIVTIWAMITRRNHRNGRDV